MPIPHKHKLESLLDRLESLVQRLEAASEQKIEADKDAADAAEKFIARRSHQIKRAAGIGPLED